MKKFIEERWYMHLVGGTITVTPIIWLLIKFDPSFDIGKIENDHALKSIN